ncbi:conserved hypothetical protein [Histoplasma capsulatum G186AR]|uniref:Rossmann-fold NAD(P)(+)-binding protein n=2 Tax=Ajellomyces capsulatus TaxID=5037 RepID=C0NQK8_AJECG|nr:uncharacterized protein HCBG_05288 [Histoplasma capsulatum G186AR]EEH05972.1 conserved hypothetical protein [Histoplasma capsulatum G186AR]KAG5293575.1 cell division cycle protein, ribosomal RNA methyltransferase MRM2 [Histoplasma capsulatum]QSS75026.1 cell division cycle protein, ribosomal RNA methyltransferase MRM2 [Histoplasma capsulatum G186AR]
MASRKQRSSAVLQDSELLSPASARLETEYEKALCHTKLIIGDEKNRIMRVQALLASHDKDDLCSEVEDVKTHLARAEKIGSEAQEQLKQARNEIDSLRNSLRVQLREIEHLKSNINELQVTAADSSKLLAEKRAMTREISNLKHEIEQLKSQALSHQALMSEKLSLERQLRSLEVELQSEKNALEKARLKDVEQNEVDSKILTELGELNKELTRERREREKIQNDMKTEALEWARHRLVLENKLTTLRNKLRQSKDDSTLDQPTILDDAGSPQEDQRRKRSTSRFESDVAITTPGAAVAHQRMSRMPAVPGEKSTFSTTPFLNRTSTTAESSGMSASDSDLEHVRKPVKRMKEDVEDNRSKSSKPSHPKATKATKRRPPPKSQNVSVMVNSDDDHENTQPTKRQNEPSTSTTNKNAGTKRRFLPRKPEGTLFDDDDEQGFGESSKDRRRVLTGFRALGGGQLGLGAPGRRLGGGRGLEAYADISPLRRNIRAAHS